MPEEQDTQDLALRRPDGGASVGKEPGSEDRALRRTPGGVEALVGEPWALFCSRVTLRTPGRAQAHSVVIQTTLGLGGDIVDKVPTGKKRPNGLFS